MTDISELLGSELAHVHADNPLEVIRLSQDGLTKDSLVRMGDALGLKKKDLAEMVFVSLRTFQRYRAVHKLSPLVSENLIQIAQVIRLGLEVFEERELLIEWLKGANKALGGKKPIELLKFRAGSDLVRNLIGQIGHGIVA